MNLGVLLGVMAGIQYMKGDGLCKDRDEEHTLSVRQYHITLKITTSNFEAYFRFFIEKYY